MSATTTILTPLPATTTAPVAGDKPGFLGWLINLVMGLLSLLLAPLKGLFSMFSGGGGGGAAVAAEAPAAKDELKNEIDAATSVRKLARVLAQEKVPGLAQLPQPVIGMLSELDRGQLVQIAKCGDLAKAPATAPTLNSLKGLPTDLQQVVVSYAKAVANGVAPALKHVDPQFRQVVFDLDHDSQARLAKTQLTSIKSVLSGKRSLSDVLNLAADTPAPTVSVEALKQDLQARLDAAVAPGRSP
jgi:hypothetical protein